MGTNYKYSSLRFSMSSLDAKQVLMSDKANNNSKTAVQSVAGDSHHTGFKRSLKTFFHGRLEFYKVCYSSVRNLHTKFSFRLLGEIIKPFLILSPFHEYITSKRSFFLQSGFKLYLLLHATAVYFLPRATEHVKIKQMVQVLPSRQEFCCFIMGNNVKEETKVLLKPYNFYPTSSFQHISLFFYYFLKRLYLFFF